MGNNDVNASIAHIVLSCVAARGTSSYRTNNYSHLGMHANFFFHGVIGLLHYQSGRLNNDFGPMYNVSYKATRYLALPCLMADLYRGNSTMCALHLASGILPFALFLTQKDNEELGRLMITCNIISLCLYSYEHNRDWGWYTAGAAVFAYFFTPQADPKVVYPLALGLMEYLAYRIFHIHIEA